LHEYSRNAEKTSGLTGPQLWGLKLLANAAPLRVSELARRMYLHPATVVGILDRLEAKGLITRTRSREDRRAVEINLTPPGKEVVASAPEVAQTLLVKGLVELTDEQLSRIAEGMEILVRILGAEHTTPQPLHAS
jgi:DNA-binding MarR family transcriptional regulator